MAAGYGAQRSVTTRSQSSGKQIPAPFFTQRVGMSVVHNPQPGPRLNHAGDGRNSFKDSYHPVQPRASGCRQWAGDEAGVVGEDVLQLQLELGAAKSEINQLRNALQVSANALQYTTRLLPPDVNPDGKAQALLMADLSKQLKERDDEILRLRRVELEVSNLKASSRASILMAVTKWAPRGEQHLVRLLWDTWKEEWSGKKLSNHLSKLRNQLEPNIMRVFHRLSVSSVSAQKKAMLSSWLAVARASSHQKEKIRFFAMQWSGDQKSMGSYCFVMWRKRTEAARHEQRMEAMQQRHEKESREAKKAMANKAALTLASRLGAPAKLGADHRIMLKAWWDLAHKERLDQKALLLMAEGDKRAQLKTIFVYWRERAKQSKLAEAHWQNDFLQRLVAGWAALTRANASQRKLEEAKAKLADVQAKHEAEKRKKTRLLEASSLFADATGALAFHAWKEHVVEVKLDRKREEEVQKVRTEMEERDKKWKDKQRQRTAGQFLGLGQQADELLLRMVWSGWKDLVLETRRVAKLSDRERILEDESRRQIAEAAELLQEVKQSEAKNHELHLQRKVKFAMALFIKDRAITDQLMLQTCMSAWAEIIQGLRGDELKKLREQLQAHQATHAPKPGMWSGVLASLCGCCKSSKKKKSTVRDGDVGPATATPGEALSMWAKDGASASSDKAPAPPPGEPAPSREAPPPTPKAKASAKVAPKAEAGATAADHGPPPAPAVHVKSRWW